MNVFLTLIVINLAVLLVRSTCSIFIVFVLKMKHFQAPVDCFAPPACFPLNAKISIKNGTFCPVQKIHQNTNVELLSATLEFGKVSATKFSGWLHNDPKFSAVFLNLVTESGDSIDLTPDHLIHVANCENNQYERTVNAENVKIGTASHLLFATIDFYVFSFNFQGTCLFVYNGTHLNPSPVLKIATSRKTGVFAPITSSGSLLVNNISVSCFSVLDNHPLQLILSRYISFTMNALHYTASFISCLFGVGYDKIFSADVEHEWRAFFSLAEKFMRDIYGSQ